MKKINFALWLALLLTLLSAAALTEAETMDNRKIMNFDTGWLYSPRDYQNGQLPLFDDTDFETVSIPHANAVLDKHKGDDFLNQVAKYRFVSWYRRHFTLPESYAGKRLLLTFEGVATVADVYVNGKPVGNHKGAYTGFTFDITDNVSIGADNVIAVRVNSTRQAGIPPEGGQVDYCVFGGIVRDVWLTAVSPTYVEDAFLTTPDLSELGGRVHSTVTVRNSSDTDKLLSVKTVVLDADGKEAASAVSNERQLPAGTVAEFEFDTDEITNPHFWSVDDPYLYTARISVLENGLGVDTYETKIGLRWFEFTETGFYLNGEKVILRGINRHEQWPYQGRAVPDKLQIRDADMVKNTGFNAVRCSHYPQDPSFLNRCDEIGLIVFEEAPGWQHIGDATWKEVYKTNVEEMILRDRNHPSIVTWGVRVNESWDDMEFVTATCTIAKALDPSRPTHGVRRRENYDITEMIEDIFCDNYIYPEDPRFKPFISSEHSWEHWTDGCGLPWASDAQAAEFTKSFADVVDYYYRNDYCLGGFGWSMFDYDNEVNYTNTGHVFYSGMYDIFRLDKPVSHFYRAQKEPAEAVELYIANYWTADSPSFVEIYSNCDEVELLVNGRTQGRIKPNLYMNVPHPAFRFENIAFEEGTITAVGYIDGAEVARTGRKTPGAADRLSVTADYSFLTADGADMTCASVELLDANGTRLPYADNAVVITLDGPADLICESPVKLEGGRIGFIVKSRYHETGNVKCTVTSDGVEAGTCEIMIREYDDENVVPYSQGKGSVEPLVIEDVNDTDSRFSYSSGWIYCPEAGCREHDNTYADAAGETAVFTFVGQEVRWYGTKAPAHGIMAVSIDGGPESFVDCWAQERQDDILLWSSGCLGAGEHRLTVRVTGEKNNKATGTFVNADHVRVVKESSGLGTDLLTDGDCRPDGASWIVGDRSYTQSDPTGDHTLTFDGGANVTTRATVPVPTINDTGYGLLGRIVDESHFYQLELKSDNGQLVWAIWRCDGWDWLCLASGPYETEESIVTMRMDMDGSVISAYALTDDRWQPLGACYDATYSTGNIGLRTHNVSGVFTDLSAYELTASFGEVGEIKDIIVKDGKLVSVQVNAPENALAVAAKYADAGSLTECVRRAFKDGRVRFGINLDGGLKLMLWSDPVEMRPLCQSRNIIS